MFRVFPPTSLLLKCPGILTPCQSSTLSASNWPLSLKNLNLKATHLLCFLACHGSYLHQGQQAPMLMLSGLPPMTTSPAQRSYLHTDLWSEAYSLPLAPDMSLSAFMSSCLHVHGVHVYVFIPHASLKQIKDIKCINY